MPGFTKFWNEWPAHIRKVGEDKCLSRWSKNGLETHADQIVAAVVTSKESRDWTKDGGEFIPTPITWLKEKRWLAVADAPKTVGKVAAEQVEETKRYLAELAAIPANCGSEALQKARDGIRRIR